MRMHFDASCLSLDMPWHDYLAGRGWDAVMRLVVECCRHTMSMSNTVQPRQRSPPLQTVRNLRHLLESL